MVGERFLFNCDEVKVFDVKIAPAKILVIELPVNISYLRYVHED